MSFFEILFRQYTWDPIKFCRTMWNIFRVKGVSIASLDIEQDSTLSTMRIPPINVESLDRIRREVEQSFAIPISMFQPNFSVPEGFNREVLNELGRNNMAIHSTEKFDTLTRDATIKDILPSAVKLEKDKAKERIDFHVSRFIAMGNEDYIKTTEKGNEGISTIPDGFVRIPEPPSLNETTGELHDDVRRDPF